MGDGGGGGGGGGGDDGRLPTWPSSRRSRRSVDTFQTRIPASVPAQIRPLPPRSRGRRKGARGEASLDDWATPRKGSGKQARAVRGRPAAAHNALGGAAARSDDFGGHAHLHMVRAQIRPRSSGSRASPVLLCRSQSMLACEVLSDRKRRGTTSIFQELLYLCSFRCKDPFPSLPVNI